MPHFYRFPQPNNTFFEEAVTPSTQLLIDEALRQGVEVSIPIGTKLVAFTKDNQTKFLHAQTPENTSYIGYYASEDKGVCRSLLQQVGIQVPKGFVLRLGQDQAAWIEVYHALTKPLVVKPTHGTQGNKVCMNIESETDFVSAVKECFTHPIGEGPGVVVEEQFPGEEYRIICTRSETIAVMQRIPANVIGDGVHSIRELIEQKNSDPRRSDNHMEALVKITVDDQMQKMLTSQQLTLSSVVENNRRVLLRSNSNLSTGGDSIDMTDTVHQSVKDLAVQAVRAIPGLAFAGVDFMSTDITTAQTPDTYRILEINKSPGFNSNEKPYQGTGRPVSTALLELLFS